MGLLKAVQKGLLRALQKGWLKAQQRVQQKVQHWEWLMELHLVWQRAPQKAEQMGSQKAMHWVEQKEQHLGQCWGWQMAHLMVGHWASEIWLVQLMELHWGKGSQLVGH